MKTYDVQDVIDYEQALLVTGDRATWELQHMIKALSMLSVLNTAEENERLTACKIVLKARKSRG